MDKKTKIIATLGPASDDEKTIKELYNSGMNVARLNFSHGTYEYFEKLIKTIRNVSDEITILLDTKGPEIRTSKVDEDLDIILDQKIQISNNFKQLSTDKLINLQYNHLFEVSKGNHILIDDGAIDIEVTSVSEKNKIVNGIVRAGGLLGSNKTVSIHGHNVKLPFLSKKDKEDILFGISQDIDVVAASFVRERKEVESLKKFLIKNGGEKIRIISKIEHSKALEDIEGIVEESFGIMVARGDLGVEIPIQKVPYIQERIIALCNELGKPVIVATQMLESMKKNKVPTRAEVNDVAQAILQGADCVMLSAETASGKFPLESVQMMNLIANEYDSQVESFIADNLTVEDEKVKKGTSLFITKSAYYAARDLKAQAIFVPTESGYSVRKVSRFKPSCQIIGICRDMTVLRQMNLSWGVKSFYHKAKFSDNDSMVNEVTKKLTSLKVLDKSRKIVITSGRIMNKSGHTNTLEIYKVQDILNR